MKSIILYWFVYVNKIVLKSTRNANKKGNELINKRKWI